jgi:hypothetical protein
MAGLRRLNSRRSGRSLSKGELATAIRRVEEIGEIGEEFIHSHLEELKAGAKIGEYLWVSQTNAVSPFDFWFEEGNVRTLLDVKSTTGKFERIIHISIPELEQMRDAAGRYLLYRVYEINEATAKLRVSGDMRDFAAGILDLLSGLPDGVGSDGISVNPKILKFGPEIRLLPPMEAA